jgi:hypothetical protein
MQCRVARGVLQGWVGGLTNNQIKSRYSLEWLITNQIELRYSLEWLSSLCWCQFSNNEQWLSADR